MLVSHGVFRIASVQRVASETRVIAQIFASADAIAAVPAGVAKPRHVQSLSDGKPLDPLTLGDHDAYDFMVGYKWQLWPG